MSRTYRPTALTGHAGPFIMVLYQAVNFFELGPGSWCPFCLAQGLMHSKSLINVSWRNQKEKEWMSKNVVHGQIPSWSGQGLQSIQDDCRKQEAKHMDRRALSRPRWSSFMWHNLRMCKQGFKESADLTTIPRELTPTVSEGAHLYLHKLTFRR